MQRDEYITDEQVVKRANAAVKMAIEKKRIMNTSIILYDRKTGQIYKENSDGSRSVIGERIRKGRYSERVNSIEKT